MFVISARELLRVNYKELVIKHHENSIYCVRIVRANLSLFDQEKEMGLRVHACREILCFQYILKVQKLPPTHLYMYNCIKVIY